MKTIVGLAVCALALAGLYWVVPAGSLEPPGSPASTMVTLEEMDAKLNALVATANTTQSYSFVGVTTATSNDGDVGWKVMSDLCQTEFGLTYPDVRMCTSAGIMNTNPADWPVIPSGSPSNRYNVAWVHPSYATSGNQTLDISGSGGVVGEGNLSSGGWASDQVDLLGLALRKKPETSSPASHGLSLSSCINLPSVACCASE